MPEMSSEVKNAIIEYVDILNLKSASNPISASERFDYEEGKKYVKVYRKYDWSRSVHSFVVKSNGDLLKAASWNAPAKGVRYNLLRDMETIRKVADVYTGYLYMSRT